MTARDGSRACVALVTRYLEACAARRFDQAESCLAGVRELVFPWGRFGSPAEAVSKAQARYRWARKHFDTWDVAERADDSTVVVVTGTLYGETIDGAPFSDIRFIDRFVIRNGRIALHQVWNDLAESGVSAPGAPRSHFGRGG